APVAHVLFGSAIDLQRDHHRRDRVIKKRTKYPMCCGRQRPRLGTNFIIAPVLARSFHDVRTIFLPPQTSLFFKVRTDRRECFCKLWVNNHCRIILQGRAAYSAAASRHGPARLSACVWIAAVLARLSSITVKAKNAAQRCSAGGMPWSGISQSLKRSSSSRLVARSRGSSPVRLGTSRTDSTVLLWSFNNCGHTVLIRGSVNSRSAISRPNGGSTSAKRLTTSGASVVGILQSPGHGDDL